ncbi:MAG: hypothetical protein CMA00_002510 [Methanobacteriota archaeon]|nr:MAG: hypothetical protein CMA00_002510 [Euryarchaeota archaeon]
MEGAGVESPVANCPACEDLVEHEEIKRVSKGKGEDVLARCLVCGNVHTILIRPPKLVLVKTTLSDGRDSQSAEIESDEDEKISVGDMFEHEGVTWRVTRMDSVESKGASNLVASEISSMWATRSDKTVVGVTMTDGEFSESSKIECSPDKVFSCGSIMELEDGRWRIRAIHTGNGRTLTGSRNASEIRRIYLHPPKKRY